MLQNPWLLAPGVGCDRHGAASFRHSTRKIIMQLQRHSMWGLVSFRYDNKYGVRISFPMRHVLPSLSPLGLRKCLVCQSHWYLVIRMQPAADKWWNASAGLTNNVPNNNSTMNNFGLCWSIQSLHIMRRSICQKCPSWRSDPRRHILFWGPKWSKTERMDVSGYIEVML